MKFQRLSPTVGVIGMVAACLLAGGATANASSAPGDPPPASVAPDVVAAWIGDHATELGTFDPAAPLTELAVLDPLLAGATVVGLGEATHGSHELFATKHRIVRHLVEDLGFRAVAFENDFGSGVTIDRYVVSGEGDPRELVATMASPLFATEEILAVVEWMREFNVDHPDDPVRFVGADILQLRQVSFDAVTDYVSREAPEQLAELESSLDPITPRGEPYEQFGWYGQLSVDDQHRLIESARDAAALVEALPAPTNTVTATEREFAIRHALAIAGWYENYANDAGFRAGRERFVADTIAWWQEMTGDNVVYWAANVHTAAADVAFSNPDDGDQAGTMAGGYLAETFGDGYASIGTWFGAGEITSDFMDPGPKEIAAPPSGLLEGILGTTPLDSYVLPLDGCEQASPVVADWCAGESTSRMILPSYMGGDDGATHTMTVPSLVGAYDALVYVGHTTASSLMTPAT